MSGGREANLWDKLPICPTWQPFALVPTQSNPCSLYKKIHHGDTESTERNKKGKKLRVLCVSVVKFWFRLVRVRAVGSEQAIGHDE